MTDAEILELIRRALAGEIDPSPGPSESDHPMLDRIDGGEVSLELCRYFESLWRYWMYPKVEAKYLVKFCYNFIGMIENKELMVRFGYPKEFFPREAVSEFRRVLQKASMEAWSFDLTKNASPRTGTGNAPGGISMPGEG